MPSLALSTAAGVGEGIDQIFQRLMLEERQRLDLRRQNEAERHDRAVESTNNEHYRQMSADRDAATQQRRDATEEGATMRRLEMRPIGSQVTPEEFGSESKLGVARGNYDWQPPNMGSTSAATGEEVPGTAGGYTWKGTEKQILEKQRNERETKASGAGSLVERRDGSLVRVKPDNSVEPIYDDQGKSLDKFHQPQAPVLYQPPGESPSLVNRASGVATPVKTARGETLGPKQTAATADRQDRAVRVLSHLDSVQAELDEAEKNGVLGPLAGRTFTEFMAGKIGSTGNPQTDELIGELRNDLSLVRSGVGSLHGRGGANIGIVKDIEKRMDEGHMSHAEISGALKSMRKWVSDYATRPGGQPATPQGGGDMYQEYLNRKKKPG